MGEQRNKDGDYYAYGLKIPAISSKAYGAANNNFLYQGDYSEFDDDLGWNDFMLRSYDAQIGRFLQNDPYDQFASGYMGMGDDPGNTVDEDGGIAGSFSLLGAVEGLQDVVVTGSKALVGAKAAAAASKSLNVGKRLMGLAQGVLGVLGAAGSAAVGVASSWTGVGAVAGGVGFVYSADVAATGFRQMLSGEDETTTTHKAISGGLQAAGVSEVSAERSATFAEVGLSIFTGGSAVSKGFTQMPKLASAAPKLARASEAAAAEKVIAKNGSTPANELGKQLHKAYKLLEHNPAKGLYKEYTGLLKKYGIKPDFVDFNTKTIYDLKPTNPAKFNAHIKQLEKYKDIFEKEFGGTWNYIIDRY